MDSPVTSELNFLHPNGIWQHDPLEWTPAWVVPGIAVEHWQSATLTCQGRPLDLALKKIDGRAAVVAEWPRSGTGRYQLAWSVGDITAGREIIIRPQRISEFAYTRMVEELQTSLPAAVAQALQSCGAMAGVKLRPPEETTLAAELNRLRRAVDRTPQRPGLVEVLKSLADDPHQRLTDRSPWMPSHRARRPRPERLHAALAGHNLDADGRPMRLVDTVYEHTADVLENRLLNSYHAEVDLRLRRLGQALPQSVVAEEIAELQSRLAAARRQAAFLDEVGRLEHAPTQPSMVLQRRPPYRAALEGYLELHRTAEVRLDEPGLDAPLENLPRLYEVWGILQVLRQALEIAALLGYREHHQNLIRRRADGFFIDILPDGKSAVALTHPDGTRVSLIPQAGYASTGDHRSISFTQRPDVVVEVRRPGQPPELWLFDPKYKLDSADTETPGDAPPLARPKKVDIDKMHAYRDAIRDTAGRRIVTYAAILYPGPHTHFSPGLAALNANPESPDSLRQDLDAVLRRALMPAVAGSRVIPVMTNVEDGFQPPDG